MFNKFVVFGHSRNMRNCSTIFQLLTISTHKSVILVSQKHSQNLPGMRQFVSFSIGMLLETSLRNISRLRKYKY